MVEEDRRSIGQVQVIAKNDKILLPNISCFTVPNTRLTDAKSNILS